MPNNPRRKPHFDTVMFDRVIVVGASVAGLLAARVVSDYARQVIVLERDRLPEDHAPGDHRAGVPQARHVHGLLERGLIILRDLFPGLDADLDAIDSPPVEWMHETVQLLPGGWSPRYHSGLVTRAVSRPALEGILRRRVRALPNVTFRERTDVNDLMIAGEGKQARVVGVVVQPRGAGETSPETVSADQVIIAGGRASHLPDWLQAHGFPAPPVTLIDAKLGYASREYALPREHWPHWASMLIQLRPEQPRGGVFTRIEGGRWLLTMAGVGDDKPPTDSAEFEAFVGSLPTPELHTALAHATPVTPIYGAARTANIFHHYERVPMPAGLWAFGDAVCAFNPVYGQGMSAAAIGAQLLGGMLAHGIPSPHTFQKQLARALAPLWLMSTSEDLRFAHTTNAAGQLIGDRFSRSERLLNRYLDLLLNLAPTSIPITQALLEVLHLRRPPAGLLRPDVFLPMLLSLLSHASPPRTTPQLRGRTPDLPQPTRSPGIQ